MLERLQVIEAEKKLNLTLMESYEIICKIDYENQDQPNRYFVPDLFRSNNQKFDSKGFHLSGWSYVGFESLKVPYIPDDILFCLAVSCLKQWKKSDIEPHYKCAKYRLKVIMISLSKKKVHTLVFNIFIG